MNHSCTFTPILKRMNILSQASLMFTSCFYLYIWVTIYIYISTTMCAPPPKYCNLVYDYNI